MRVRSECGEAVFPCKEGKVPEGMLFVPYGPPTCHLMGGITDGTGMPTSKGWEVDVEPIAPEAPAGAFAIKGDAMNAASPRRDLRELQEAALLPAAGDAEAGEPRAWEMIDAGRYMPRRIRGSFRGRVLG